ncbi:chloride channel protein 2-like isoform X2 [Artemia franciscana]|uniref:chloride channel protein 2-like isoform X2 n=1 Tax=Artemia franciscana TaxID=6661 RepID=UPI0032DA40DE
MDTGMKDINGLHSDSLIAQSKDQKKRFKLIEKERKKAEKERAKELQAYRGKWTSRFDRVFGWLLAKIGEDTIFLAFLGIIVAIISFVQDYIVVQLHRARIQMYDLTSIDELKFFAWVILPVSLVVFAAGFAHLVAPQAIGSGMPEMRTILRGIILKEYLSFRTLVAKCVGLTATLGAGMPIGKEGPLVHIASMVASLMSKFVTSLKGTYENESRKIELLAAACAVGVSACFGAPIGGVLFSIEVTSVFFAIRSYWRGFYSAVFGTLTFRLLAYWYEDHDTITAIFRTNFLELPYDPHELFIYSIFGMLCGLLGAIFVFCHRQYVMFLRNCKCLKAFFARNRFIYPFLVSLTITAVYFPPGTGQFLASRLSQRQQIMSLFSNFTWGTGVFNVRERAIVEPWLSEHTSIYFNLAANIVVTFFFTIAAVTLPVPCGTFVPVFKLGAVFGRLVGEIVALMFPDGLRVGSYICQIIPGGYSVVGAAAFAGGVTHSVSICVVVSEMTGQIKHIIPIMIAVLSANLVAKYLQPSFYDSMILIKKLPYLPDFLPSKTGAYNVYVQDFMVRDVRHIWNGITFRHLKKILKENPKIRAFPIVDTPGNKILLGSIQRWELIHVLNKHLGKERRQQVAVQWQEEASTKNEGSLLGNGASPETEKNEDQPPNFASRAAKETPQTELPLDSSLASDPILPVAANGNEPVEQLSRQQSFFDGYPIDVISGRPRGPTIFGRRPRKKVQLPKARVIDMSLEEQSLWEEAEMEKSCDLAQCHIDPAPFQLVERTSLMKVHALFSMMGVNYAYVTAVGRLIGVVALPDLRKAIENVNSGILHPSKPISPLDCEGSFYLNDPQPEQETLISGRHSKQFERNDEQDEGEDEGGLSKVTYEYDKQTGQFTRVKTNESDV